MAVVATKKRGGPRLTTILSLGAAFAFMILGFQNCAVDLATTTPGASTSGSCGTAPAQALTDIQPVISNVLATNCASCHGRTTGTVSSAFYVPDASENAATPAVQSFAYLQLCIRGGTAVGLKIDGSTSHGGGTFARGGGQSALFDYLDLYF